MVNTIVLFVHAIRSTIDQPRKIEVHINSPKKKKKKVEVQVPGRTNELFLALHFTSHKNARPKKKTPILDK